MRAAWIRRRLARVRWLPVHPQWLLHASDEASDLDEALTGLHGDVVDVGCSGKGLASRIPANCRYIGLDYPDTALGLYGTRPDVFADARSLPFADASLGGVILKDVLEHICMPEKALLEIGRVLADGGRLVVWMPFIYPIHDAPYDFQRFSEYGLGAYLAHAGMRMESLKPALAPVETASLLMALALADVCEQILLRRKWLVFLLPFLGLSIAFVNVAGKVLSWLPCTKFMPAFYRVTAVREVRGKVENGG